MTINNKSERNYRGTEASASVRLLLATAVAFSVKWFAFGNKPTRVIRFVILTLASKILSTPSSIVLTSPCLRPRGYIAIITRDLTNCIIVLCCILWASNFYSIGWYSQRWISVRCSAKRERKDNLKEQFPP